MVRGRQERNEPMLVSLADYERKAAARLGDAAFAYCAGGAADELTLRDNEVAWRRIAIVPKALVGVGSRDPSVTVLGRLRPHPLIAAPMAFQRLVHPDGECALARAAASTATVMCLSTLASTSVPALAAAVPQVGRWFQLYVLRDRGVTRELVSQAVENGYEAIVLTVDLPVGGVRERELRSPATAPLAGAVETALTGGGSVNPLRAIAQVDPDLRWSDVAELARDCPLPLIVKGILTPGDAELAGEHGARGVIVSNHGGRQLDTVLSGADALPAVVDRVGDRLDVLVDGGIRRGTDVLKALALGARAALVGRPLLWGLAVAGEEGAAAVMKILLDEFDRALALAGAPNADRIGREWVTPARGWADFTTPGSG